MDYSRSIIELIRERSSRRSYTPQPVEAEQLGALKQCFAALKGPFGGEARFLILDTTGWDEGKINALGTYGTIQGAKLFIIGIIKRGEHAMEDFGYQFEKIILRATDLGLGTCWIGGIFNRSRFADRAGVREDEVLPAVSPLGYATPKRSVTDSIIRWSAGSRNRRPWHEIFFDGSFELPLTQGTAGRYLEALEMLRLGPSASNRQPWRVVKEQGREIFHLYLCRSRGYDKLIKAVDLQRMDMGIAMSHFELTAGQLGLGGRWENRPPSLDRLPDRTQYIRSWIACWLISLLALVSTLTPTCAESGGRTSKPIAAVLREPLPPEELQLSSSGAEWVVTGPTFTYHVQRSTGVITALRVSSETQEVIGASSPAEIQLDDCRLTSHLVSSQVLVLTQTTHQIVLRSQGILRDPAQKRPEADCTLLHTFYDDGVVVTAVKLIPREDLPVEKSLLVQLEVQGQFSHYLHKRRDEHGESAVRGPLSESGSSVRFSTLTSCLHVFGHNAALALFTDCGATYLSRTNLDTAVVEVTSKARQNTELRLRQYLLHVAPGDQPYVLKAGEEFSFRVGISVAPNRIAPPRLHDLRMFAWVGDAKFPYPTDQEIEVVAQNGFTLFQMHRLGTPGEPRPPASELERVIKKTHELGMLFLWTENADLMYDSAPGVQELKAKGQFSRWQGFNYGGRYKASMDPYCDLVATCLASPNGLAEYRLATIRRMLDRFAVDGIYLDDNLAYPNCTLWREHGHPRPVYDCLIELHEVNWQRRQLLRSKCPHLVLVSHNTRAIILPVLCDFDAALYGEGYSFGSLENYWDYYLPVNGIPAQGMIWPGGQDPVRCAAAVAYNFDLLTGGGQYCYIDWRLFPKKFPYGAGVTDTEHLYVQTFNLAQYYFGLYESKPYCFANSAELFATSTPLTCATIYRNQVWGDWLITIANMAQERRETALELRAPQALGIDPEADYLLFDVLQRTARIFKGRALGEAFKTISIPVQGLQLFCLRPLPAQGIGHVWGGKRISEEWDAGHRKLTLAGQGPPGVQETLFFGGVQQGIEEVEVNGKTQPFFFDPAQGLVHGNVTFSSSPLKIEVLVSPGTAHALPQRPVTAAPLAKTLKAQP